MKGVRVLAVLALIGLGTSCAEPAEPGSGTPGFARVAVRAAAPASLVQFAPALIVEQMRISLLRFSQVQETTDTILTRVVSFGETTNQVNLSLSVPVSGLDTLFLSLEYETADGERLFSAGDYVVVGPNRTSNPPVLQPSYVGPGSNISFMSMNGDDTTVTAGSDVQLDVTAFDGSESEVSSFYLSWSTNDPRVTVSPRGVVHTRPDVTQTLRVTATTPSGVEASTLMFIQGSAAFALTPDSVELRPGATQFFQITISRDVSINWSVGGIIGGNATVGTISTDGLYTAPAAPLPAGGTQLCVTDAEDASATGCAKVFVPAVPSVGADVVVINDQNIFDSIPMKRSGNVRFAKNLVNFTGSGVRSSGKTVWYDRGRNAPCMLIGQSGQECGDGEKGRFNKVLEGEGFRIVRFDSYTPIRSIPVDVKVLILWMPLISFDFDEIETLKRFASEGGRIVFIGEWADYYSDGVVDGITLENGFLRDLGSGMSNVGAELDCVEDDGSYPVSGANSLRTHPLTTGVSNLSYACASAILTGPDDIPFFYDIANTQVLGAVAKIDLGPPPGIRARTSRSIAAPAINSATTTTRSGLHR